HPPRVRAGHSYKDHIILLEPWFHTEHVVNLPDDRYSTYQEEYCDRILERQQYLPSCSARGGVRSSTCDCLHRIKSGEMNRRIVSRQNCQDQSEGRDPD